MSPAWAAVIISLVVALGAVGRELAARGRHDGQLDQCVMSLTKIVEDHEVRLRALEAGRLQAITPSIPRRPRAGKPKGT